MDFWGATDQGRVRASNQDAFLTAYLSGEKDCALVMVCDGMGGAKAGNVASELAVRTFSEAVKAAVRSPGPMLYIEKEMASAAQAANRAIYEAARQDENFAGMGTTLVAAVLAGESAAILNVGDSRAYRISPAGIEKITRDHSLVAEMVEKGELTEEQAHRHPSKNLITRALGAEMDVSPDTYLVDLKKGQFLLLCSDGLTNLVNEQEILFEVLHGPQAESCCQRLIGIANTRGGGDNITVVLVSV